MLKSKKTMVDEETERNEKNEGDMSKETWRQFSNIKEKTNILERVVNKAEKQNSKQKKKDGTRRRGQSILLPLLTHAQPLFQPTSHPSGTSYWKLSSQLSLIYDEDIKDGIKHKRERGNIVKLTGAGCECISLSPQYGLYHTEVAVKLWPQSKGTHCNIPNSTFP
jgi:hypothetical protein